MTGLDDSASAPVDLPPIFPANPSFQYLLSDPEEPFYRYGECPNLAPTSEFDKGWGYVFENHDLPAERRDVVGGGGGGGGGGYSSNDCWSAASEDLTSTWQNSGSCYQDAAMVLVPSTPPFLNVSSNVASTSCPPQDGEQREMTKNLLTGSENLLQNTNNMMNSSYNTQSSSSESDEDEIQSTEINEVETDSESSVAVREWKHEVNSHVPDIGMIFSSEEQAYKFYKRYAGKMSFKVRKGKVQRSSNGAIRKRDLFCSRQGFRLKKQSNKMTKYKRKETRTGCNAKMQITFENGKWVISSFNSEHNHDLEGSIQKQTRNSCINLSETHSTIQPILIRMAKEGKAAECVGFCDENYGNYLHNRKVNSLQPEDIQMFINYFKHLQLEDPSFFYTVQVDAETHLTNFFWRDGRSKMDYDYFGDVLILDTTFRQEKYNMICAPFLGLNHHRQYVLFGCAFLLDETMESYIWLLGTFMEAMGRCHPKTIFTNECQAIAKAVEIVLPKTEHRLHIQFLCRNATQKLLTYYGQPRFESLFNRCLFDCQSKEEFESLWVTLLDQYNLHENLWLQNLYTRREKWSYLFSKMTFSAGIQSEQGSYKINDVFRNMRSETMTLLEYVQQYEKAAEQQRREELFEDFRCNASEPVKILRSSVMEKQAANIYTHTTFKIFQEELLGFLSVALEEIASIGTTATFKLTEEGHKKENFVAFNCADSTISCSCKMFESIGILCVHALKVLNTRNIFQIPPQYILKRWTKAAKDGLVVADDGEEIADKSDRPLSLRSSKLMHKALNVITKSLPVEEGRKLVDRQLDITWKMLEDVLKTKGIEHVNMKDAEVDHEGVGDTSGIVRMEREKWASRLPYVNQEERFKCRMKCQIHKKRKNEVREMEPKLCVESITHHQIPKEVLNGIHQESSGGYSHSYCLGDNTLQFASNHSQALTSLKSTVHQIEDPSMPMIHIQDTSIDHMGQVEPHSVAENPIQKPTTLQTFPSNPVAGKPPRGGRKMQKEPLMMSRSMLLVNSKGQMSSSASSNKAESA